MSTITLTPLASPAPLPGATTSSDPTISAYMAGMQKQFDAQYASAIAAYITGCQAAISNAINMGRNTPLAFGPPPGHNYMVQLDPNDLNSTEIFSRVEFQPYPTWTPAMPAPTPPPPSAATQDPTGNTAALNAIQASLATLQGEVSAILTAVTKPAG